MDTGNPFCWLGAIEDPCVARQATIEPQASKCQAAKPRRFPAPWTIEKIPGGFKVLDATGQSLAYVYGVEGDPTIGKTLTLVEARRIASNIAKLAELSRSNK